ncbi:hypothetical protein VB779_02735 [Haloarculaceae archaeon H-GB11]|nr:hypothetical protein [Haloarculaceae archaeon H-GB11]
MAIAKENGTLRRAVTCVGDSDGEPHDAIGHKPSNLGGDHAVTNLGTLLHTTFPSEEFSFNLYFEYWHSTNGREQALVYPNTRQPPDENAVTVVERVTLYDSMGMSWNSAGQSYGCAHYDQQLEAASSGDFYADDVDSPQELYNVVEVRLVIW